MFELINVLDMKEGEMYFIKNREFIIGEVLFAKYHQTNNNQPFIVFRYPYISGCSYVRVKDISIYRYVSEEEYWTKVKEKYNSKCLDIVLKRLIDESFQW
jgi:hypothetical protein